MFFFSLRFFVDITVVCTVLLRVRRSVVVFVLRRTIIFSSAAFKLRCDRVCASENMNVVNAVDSFISLDVKNISFLSVYRTVAPCFSIFFFIFFSFFYFALRCVELCVYFFCCLSFHSHKLCVRFLLLLYFSIFESLLCLTLAHFYSQFDGFAETRTVRFSASASVFLNSVIFFGRTNPSVHRVY